MVLRVRSPLYGRVVALVVVAGLAGCANAPEATQGPPVEYDGAPRALDEIECATLLTDRELEGVLGVPVSPVPVGRVASSCYWHVGGGVVQLVLQTGATVERWRSLVLKTYTRSVDTGIDAWNEPAKSSIAAFGPERGLIVHGVRDPAQAIAVLRLALPRL